MGINAGNVKGDNKNFAPQPDIEDGMYPARLVQVIDLGVQPQRAFKGEEKKPAHEVMFTFELVDCFLVDEDGEDVLDKPRWVSCTFPLFPLIADRAKSTKLADALDPKRELEGDFAKMIGFPVNVTLGTTKKDQKTYTNVLGFSAMRARDAANCPELVNPTKIFDLDNPDLEVFEKLPEWLRDKIKNNLGYKASKLEEALGGRPADDKPEQPKDEPKPKVKRERNPEPAEQEGVEGEDEDTPW